MKIVKSPRLNALLKDLRLIQTDPDNIESIIKTTLNPIRLNGHLNEFTTVIPLNDNAKARKKEFLDFSGIVQPVIFEFDYDDLDHQMKRAKYMSKKIGTITHLIYSGGKSLHLVQWFKRFASDSAAYIIKWFEFYYYLSQEFPDLYYYCDTPKDKLKKSNFELYSKIDWKLAPDLAMASANRYFRQANGFRKETKQVQQLTVLNSMKEYEALSLDDFIADVVLPKNENAREMDKSPQNDFDLIKSKVDLKELIERETGQQFMRNGKMNPCPICGHNDCFTIDTEKNLWNCFSDSHLTGGSIIDFVVEYKRFDKAEALQWIAEREGIELNQTTCKERKTDKNNRLIFDPVIEVEIFRSNRHIIFHHEQIKEYRDKYYKSLSDRYFLNLVTQQLKPFNSRQYKAREVLETLKNFLTDPDIDTKVNQNPFIWNLKNGLLDIRTTKLQPHNPKYLSTFRINANYNPDARCESFMKFLEEIFVGDNYKTDKELIRVVQEFIGYCLLAKIIFHKAVIFFGQGNNGKSVLVYIIIKLLEGHISNVHFESIGRDVFATADLSGSLLNISSEISTNAQLKDGVVKQIISGDTIRAQRKNQPAFDFRPVAKHIVTANNFPRSTDRSFAFFRRFMVIPFNQTFLSEKEIQQQPEDIRKFYRIEKPNLEEVLYKELDGILLWALRGLKRLLKNKSFSYSSQINALNKVFKIRSTTVESFIDEKVNKSDVTVDTEFSIVFQEYVEFCKSYQLPPLSNRRFATELRNQGFIVEQGAKNKTFVRGCSLQNQDSDLPF